MNNQEIFLLISLVVLIIIKYINSRENFELNNYPCVNHPRNSNCTCPTNVPSQRVLGEFPMNYGEKSPYSYNCVSNDVLEPSTNVYPSP